jgi:hypothetical protein
MLEGPTEAGMVTEKSVVEIGRDFIRVPMMLV